MQTPSRLRGRPTKPKAMARKTRKPRVVMMTPKTPRMLSMSRAVVRMPRKLRARGRKASVKDRSRNSCRRLSRTLMSSYQRSSKNWNATPKRLKLYQRREMQRNLQSRRRRKRCETSGIQKNKRPS